MYNIVDYINTTGKEKELGRSGNIDMEALKAVKILIEDISCFKRVNNNKMAVVTLVAMAIKIGIHFHKKIGIIVEEWLPLLVFEINGDGKIYTEEKRIYFVENLNVVGIRVFD